VLGISSQSLQYPETYEAAVLGSGLSACNIVNKQLAPKDIFPVDAYWSEESVSNHPSPSVKSIPLRISIRDFIGRSVLVLSKQPKIQPPQWILAIRG